MIEAPPGTARIPLMGRCNVIVAWTLVDESDAPFLRQWRWGINPAGTGYAVRHAGTRGKNYRAILMHRVIMGLDSSNLLEVDHINHDTLDNRHCNLRCVSHAQNLQNKCASRNSTSQYRGVYKDSGSGRWRARITLSGVQWRLGSFDSEDEAAAVAAQWRAQLMPFSLEALANR